MINLKKNLIYIITLFSIYLIIFFVHPEKVLAIENEDLEIFEYSELEEAIQTLSSVSNFPDTNSKHIIAIDRNSNRILFEKDGFSKTAMASTTKIMTAIIAIENYNLDEKVSISKSASNINGSTLGILYNTQMSLRDLLYGLMLRSGNDCAIAIAEHIRWNSRKFCQSHE